MNGNSEKYLIEDSRWVENLAAASEAGLDAGLRVSVKIHDKESGKEQGREVIQKLQDELGLVPVDTEPVVPENAAESIAEQIGTVYVPVVGDPTGRIRTPKGWVYPDGEHANGLFSVPFDGYAAILHKGERVVPAREVAASRNYNSNLYVESMYMNNGTDAAGLAAAMAAAQRRTMRGYGS